MRSYKKWSKEDRLKSLAITNNAKKLGLIQNPKKCNRCGQTQGILHLHNEDYDYTLNELPALIQRINELTQEEREQIAKCLEPICWTCHMIHHSVHRNKEAHDEYFRKVYEENFIPEPVYKHDFSILRKYGF